MPEHCPEASSLGPGLSWELWQNPSLMFLLLLYMSSDMTKRLRASLNGLILQASLLINEKRVNIFYNSFLFWVSRIVFLHWLQGIVFAYIFPPLWSVLKMYVNYEHKKIMTLTNLLYFFHKNQIGMSRFYNIPYFTLREAGPYLHFG